MQTNTNQRAPSSHQVGGTHYVSKVIQPWDFIIANDLSYLEGNIVKYCSRWRDKGGVQDLEKALQYFDKCLEIETDKRRFKALNYYRFIGMSPDDYSRANSIGPEESEIIAAVTLWRNQGGLAELRAGRDRLARLIQSESLPTLTS